MKHFAHHCIYTGVIAAAVCALAVSQSVNASELRYRPLNPAFGGNPFNSGYLQGTAESQKQYDAPVRQSNRRDPLADFSNTLTRSLLNRLSLDISDAILGENAQDSGEFVVDSMTLRFQRDGDLVNINILDGGTGNETNIALPVPQF